MGNRDRQAKSRGKKAMKIPKANDEFENLVQKICKVAKTSPKKANILVKSFVLGGFCANAKSKPISILHLQSLKNSNCVEEHRKLVCRIQTEYGSLRKASASLNVPWKTFHRLCQKVQKRKKMVREQWVDIRNFYTQDNISQELPNIKTAGRRYMTKTLDESYTVYKEDCVKLGKKSVSFATFCRFRPKKVFTINKTPDRQCICDQCENFRQLRQAFHANKIRGIASHTDECIKESVCKVSKCRE